MTQFAALLLSTVMLAGPAAPDAKTQSGKMIDNPEYAQWAQFKVGSFVTLKNTAQFGTHKSISLSTQTLKSVAKDKIVIETRMEVEGFKQKIPPQTRVIPAKIAKPKKPTTTQPKDKPDLKTKEGEEVLDIDGRKIKAHWVESQTKIGEIVTKSKVWNSKEVPGGVVKMTSQTSGKVETTTESVLTKIKAIKK